MNLIINKRMGAVVFLLALSIGNVFSSERRDDQKNDWLSSSQFSEKKEQLSQQSGFDKKNSYQQYFAEAYSIYPNIPEGLLESLAYTSTHWKHRLPALSAGHLGMPQGYGLFGLYNTDRHGFYDILDEVAKFNKVSVSDFLLDEQRYILLSAKYISKQIELTKSDDNTIEASAKVIAKLSGIVNRSAISQYAIDSFVYQVLYTRHKGFKLDGIEFQGTAVDFSKVFSKQQLIHLRAPKIIIDTINDKISLLKKTNKTSSLFSTNNSDVDYPGAIWVPAANFSSRNGTAIDHVVIHTMQGSYSGSIAYFQDSATQASAHYMIRSGDGQITQMVHEFDKAWHVRSANPYTVGIEHEGFVDDRSWYTEAMYTESAKLTQSICLSYDIDCTKVYDGPSHSDVVLLSQDYTVKGHQHYPDQTHTDPGINWDWPYYHDLVNGVVAPNRFPEAIFSLQCSQLSCDLDANASNDPDGNVVDYQWDFGDSSAANGAKVSHQYTNAGSFSVTLTVVDNIGAANSLVKTVSVTSPPPPQPAKKSGGGSLFPLLSLLAGAFITRRRIG